MTEDQAKEKWCPFARVPLTNVRNEIESGSPVVNRCTDGRINSSVLCIGSACMAWRKAGQIGIGPNGERRDLDLDGLTRWVDEGFCGLAGRPE